MPLTKKETANKKTITPHVHHYLPVADPNYNWNLQLDQMPSECIPGQYAAIVIDNLRLRRRMAGHSAPQFPYLEWDALMTHAAAYAEKHQWPTDGVERVVDKLLAAWFLALRQDPPDIRMHCNNVREWPLHSDRTFQRYGEYVIQYSLASPPKRPSTNLNYTPLANYARWLTHRLDHLVDCPSVWKETHRFVDHIRRMDDAKFASYLRQPHSGMVVRISESHDVPLSTRQGLWHELGMEREAVETIALGYAFEYTERHGDATAHTRIEHILDRNGHLQRFLQTELMSSDRWMTPRIQTLVTSVMDATLNDIMQKSSPWLGLDRSMGPNIVQRALPNPDWRLHVYRTALSDELFKIFPQHSPTLTMDKYRHTAFHVFDALLEAMPLEHKRTIFDEWLSIMSTPSKSSGHSNWQAWADMLQHQHWTSHHHDEDINDVDLFVPWLMAFQPTCMDDLKLMVGLGSSVDDIGAWLTQWLQQRSNALDPIHAPPLAFDNVEGLW